ncbi:hypothetical protein GALMADRAFT_787511 [Galerina marginata CBS 339.88]|uniref:Uncharacterized protein n=1 Tax=Galerina marginata (strain CBS 339.88) TaxID=685588 RepID=A0A067SUZ8_GALM3|nr:hypothetical protein GALMADRAFT_787511 [Galerina marginata CBS 339.88]
MSAMSVTELILICLVLADELRIQVKTQDLVLWKCSGLPDDDTLDQTLKILRFDGSDDRLVRLSFVRRQLSQYLEMMTCPENRYISLLSYLRLSRETLHRSSWTYLWLRLRKCEIGRIYRFPRRGVR